MGADGILSVTPYYNKPTQEGLYQHYKAIAGSTGLPIVLYNVPGRTGVNLEVKTVARLSEIRNIVGVKEASANIVQMCEIYASCREDFLLLSGDDPLTVAVMAIGGRGVISVASNAMPAEMVQIVELCEKGDYAGARKLHAWLLPLHPGQLRRGEPDSGEGGDGGDGPPRGDVSAAAGAAERRRARQDHARAAGPEDARRRRPCLT